ncbi:MAG: hypothetical protein GY943_37705 [Chloroflexi bacterium]|nr:hypothetical protein [Chloroflexota bacterium]
MIKLNYNFEPADLPNWSQKSLATLFQTKRRDAIFAYAVQDGHYFYALRDHLGTVPVFWRQHQKNVQCATNLSALVYASDSLNKDGVIAYLSFGTTKITPLINQVQLVPPGTAICVDTVTGQVSTLYQHQFSPVPIPTMTRAKTLTARGDKLMMQAVMRQIKADQVGLFLSGGIDSSLIGLYLKKAGIGVNAYTAALWGKTSSEIPYAKINAETIKTESHHIAYLESDQYQRLYNNLSTFYKGPHATTTALGIRFLWESGHLEKEKQLFFGQNSDTMTCSVGQQFHAYLLGQIPQAWHKGVSKLVSNMQLLKLLTQPTLIDNYLSLVSDGLWDTTINLPILKRLYGRSLLDITLAGMLIGHSPSDGEVIAQPAFNQQQLISNPYYDVDLIEFCMGLPLWYRLGFTKESKIKIGLKKRIFQDIASQYLPKSLVQRKKAFTVPMERDAQTKNLVSMFPQSLGNLVLKPNHHRFGAGMLQQWCANHQIKVEGILN